MRLLVFGCGQDHLGFGRLTRALAAALSRHHEVHFAAPDLFAPETTVGWRLHHNPEPGDVYGLTHLERTAASLQPDLALLIGDYWLLGRAVARVRRAAHAKVVVYFPIDGKIRADALAVPLGDPDWVVVYNGFSEREFLGAVAGGRILPGQHTGRLAVIGHGVDPSQFYPLPDRAAVRRNLFGKTLEGDDAFIVLNANRNGPRKRIAITLAGFALFAQGKPANVKLCLNMGKKEIGIDLGPAIRSLGLSDRVLLTAKGDQHPRLPLGQLNELFNACDIGISTSLGEGWGLVPFEHGLTGSAQVLPAHSAFEELWTGAAEMIPPEGTVPVSLLIEGWPVTPAAVRDALERLYLDRQYLAVLKRAAMSRAGEPQFTWKAVACQWNRTFEQVAAA